MEYCVQLQQQLISDMKTTQKVTTFWLTILRTVFLLLQTATLIKANVCGQTNISPMQVGGADGATEFVAVDHYANKLLTVHSSSAFDMLSDQDATDVQEETVSMSILQVTDFNVLVDSNYRDSATTMVAMADQIAAASFEIDGTGIVTLSNVTDTQSDPTLSYLNDVLHVVTSTKIILADHLFPAYDIGPGSVFAIAERDEHHVFVVLSHNQEQVFIQDQYMESRLIHLTGSSSALDFQIVKISVLSTKAGIISANSLVDPINIISGFSLIKPTQLCDNDATGQYSIAYWLSYADNMQINSESSINEFEQMSCLEVHCDISTFGSQTEQKPTKSICLHDPERYQITRFKDIVTGWNEEERHSYKRKANSIYLPSEDVVVSVIESYGETPYLTFVPLDSTGDSSTSGSIQTTVVYIEILGWEDNDSDLRAGSMALHNDELYLTITELRSSGLYAISLLKFSGDYRDNGNHEVYDSIRIINISQSTTQWPTSFAFLNDNAGYPQEVVLGYSLTKSELKSVVRHWTIGNDQMEFDYLQSFLFLIQNRGINAYMCPIVKNRENNRLDASPDYYSVESEVGEGSQIVSNMLGKLESVDEERSYSARNGGTETLPWNLCDDPPFEPFQSSANFNTVVGTDDPSRMYYKIPLVPFSHCYYRLRSFTFSLSDSTSSGSAGSRRRLPIDDDSAYYEESESDNQVYLYVPADILVGGTPLVYTFSITYSNNQEFTSELQITDDADAVCDIDASHYLDIPFPYYDSSLDDLEELEFPYYGLFDGRSGGDLEVGFKFRPEIYMVDPASPIDDSCGFYSIWQSFPSQNVTDVGDSATSMLELTEIFERFQTTQQIVQAEAQAAASGGDSSDFVEHLLVTVDATVRQEWAIANKDAFPVVLTLTFVQVQGIQSSSSFNDFQEYQLDSIVTLELDYACPYSVEFLAPLVSSQEIFEFTKEWVLTRFPIEQIALADFEVSYSECSTADVTITIQVTLIDSSGNESQLLPESYTSWLTQTSCCLEIDLNGYYSTDSAGGGSPPDTETTTCYNVDIYGTINPYPGYEQIAHSREVWFFGWTFHSESHRVFIFEIVLTKKVLESRQHLFGLQLIARGSEAMFTILYRGLILKNHHLKLLQKSLWLNGAQTLSLKVQVDLLQLKMNIIPGSSGVAFLRRQNGVEQKVPHCSITLGGSPSCGASCQQLLTVDSDDFQPP